jgi:hypothetical protein
MCSNAGSLAEQVDLLAAVQVEALPISELQAFVADAAGAMNRLGGVVSRAVGEIQVRGAGQVPASDGGVCPTPAWLRSVTQGTGHSAGRQIRTAVALRELPAVAEAIIDGVLTVEHGRVLAGLVGKIDPAALLGSQPALIEVARRTDPDQLAHYVRHLIATHCPPALEADEQAAEQRQFFTVRNTHRGSWRGNFELTDAAMEPVLTVLEAMARRDGPDDTRSAGRRRADVIPDVFSLALRHADLPDTAGSRPRLTYVIPAAWSTALAGWIGRLHADPLATPDGSSISPPWLASPAWAAPVGFTGDPDQHPGAHCASAPWTGPATRTQIQTLLCEARIERVVLDADGQIVSLASFTDQITAAQRRAVAARDRCCTAKGCSKPPAFCDVHHLRARADGGPTDIGNLVLLCRRHHVMWHRQQLTLTDLRVPWLRLPQPRAPDPD